MAEYIIQKAVNVDKVLKGSRLTVEEYSEQFIAQDKYDGCCAVVKLGLLNTPVVLSRTGETCLSMQQQAAGLKEALTEHLRAYRDLVLIAEAWWPGKDQFAEISGAFRKKSEQRPRLEFIVNDCLTGEEFADGYTSVGYYERFQRIAGLGLKTAVSYSPGSYGHAQELCNSVVDQGGYDGLILRAPMGGWKRGAGTTGEIVKIKRELSFDLRVLEVNTAVGDKTGRTVYKLVVDFQGKRLGVGSGLPHDFANVPKIGDIVEVNAMDYSSDGLLREPRYKGIRHDKIEADK